MADRILLAGAVDEVGQVGIGDFSPGEGALDQLRLDNSGAGRIKHGAPTGGATLAHSPLLSLSADQFPCVKPPEGRSKGVRVWEGGVCPTHDVWERMPAGQEEVAFIDRIAVTAQHRQHREYQVVF